MNIYHYIHIRPEPDYEEKTEQLAPQPVEEDEILLDLFDGRAFIARLTSNSGTVEWEPVPPYVERILFNKFIHKIY